MNVWRTWSVRSVILLTKMMMSNWSFAMNVMRGFTFTVWTLRFKRFLMIRFSAKIAKIRNRWRKKDCRRSGGKCWRVKNCKKWTMQNLKPRNLNNLTKISYLLMSNTNACTNLSKRFNKKPLRNSSRSNKTMPKMLPLRNKKLEG